MTNEEAIKVLNMVEAHGVADVAKQRAIEALKEQPVRYRDCISRADAIDRVGHWIDGKATDDAQARAVAIINDLRYLPSAIPQPITQPESADRPKGKWVDEHENGHGFWVGRCNQCGKESHVSYFCPNCGAKMKGGDTE